MPDLSLSPNRPPEPSQPIWLSPGLATIFSSCIVDKIRFDPRTEKRREEHTKLAPNDQVYWWHFPLGVPFHEVREVILQKGRTDFRLPEPGYSLSVDDKALLYAYSNMRRHIATLRHVLQTHDHLFRRVLFVSPSSTVVDIGCGPLTGALAFTDFLHQGGTSASFVYRCVDQAPRMVSLGCTLIDAAIAEGLLQSRSGWKAHLDYSSFPAHEAKTWASPQGAPVILLFSHLFASDSLDPHALSYWVNQIADQLPNVPMAILMTNSPHQLSGKKWRSFRAGLSGFSTIDEAETRRFAFNGETKLVEYSMAVLGRNLPGQILGSTPHTAEEILNFHQRTLMGDSSR